MKIDYHNFYKSLRTTIQVKQHEFDKRFERFSELVEKFERYQSINPEQAEAYLSRARHHETRLEDQMVEIKKLQKAAQKIHPQTG